MSDAVDDRTAWPAPRENPDLIGQGAAEAAFVSAHASGRLAHAWLIAGPRGIGKATFAFRCARALLAGALDASGGALHGPEASLAVPPDHPVFRRIAAAGHANLRTVERERHAKTGRLRTDIVVESVRALRPFFGQTAAEQGRAGWRIAVIDGAEEMNPSAANALLKMLEEPPERGLILLVSHAPGCLPPTLRSRCRLLTLRPLAASAIEAILSARFPALADDDERRRMLARLGDGSVGRALALAASGGDAFRELFDILAGLPTLDHAALHALGDRLARPNNQADYQAVAETLVWWLARMIRATAMDAAPDQVVGGEAALIERLARPNRLDRWVEVWDKIVDLFARAEQLHLDRKQVLLSAFATLAQAARGHPPARRAA